MVYARINADKCLFVNSCYLYVFLCVFHRNRNNIYPTNKLGSGPCRSKLKYNATTVTAPNQAAYNKMDVCARRAVDRNQVILSNRTVNSLGTPCTPRHINPVSSDYGSLRFTGDGTSGPFRWPANRPVYFRALALASSNLS